MCVAAIAFTACTNELEEGTMPTDNALVLTVGDYPAFSEGTNTRIGTFDPGKTAWEEGDQILVSVTSSSSNQYATLTYENNTWTPSQTLTRPEGTFTVEAWYAPTYSWDSNGNMTTSAAGTGEFLHQTLANQSQRNIEINFSSVSRNYSRLRIVCSSGTNLNVSLTNFTPAGDGTALDSYALTTDDKGNAYLYGTWTGSSNLDVTYGSTSLVDKNITTASVANTSYVVDASFTNISNPTTCDAIGNGKQDCPYILLNGAQLNDLATNSSANRGAQYKMDENIDLSPYSSNWTPFSFSGTFDGNGHSITGFNSAVSTTTTNFGLFNQNTGTIKNLTINNCQIKEDNGDVSGTYIGAIAYWNNGGTIENCHVNGTMEGDYVAGITCINDGNIVACSNSADIVGYAVAGISFMVMRNAQFIGCCNFGTLSGSAGSFYILGTGNGTISACYWLNNGTVIGDNGATNWEAAIDDMNNALQSAGYDYQYVLENGVPVIKNP